jgi:alpha-glucosidase
MRSLRETFELSPPSNPHSVIALGFRLFAQQMRTMRNLLLMMLLLPLMALGQQYQVKSPNGLLRAEVNVAGNIHFRLYRGKRILLHSKPIGLQLKRGVEMGQGETVVDAQEKNVNRTVKPVVPYRAAKIEEHYNALTLVLSSGLRLEFRCFDDGLAYRMVTEAEGELIILNEEMGFEVTTDPDLWFPQESSFFSHNERKFIRSSNQTIGKGNKASTPILWKWGNGPVLLYTETDLRDYPGMYMQSKGEGAYLAIYPKVPATHFKFMDRWVMSAFKHSYIAKTGGKRSFPWRVFMVADNEGKLLDSHLPWLLAQEHDPLEPTDWIKPGKVAWDWWNALNLQGVDFKPGVNTQTYKYYIDFAAANGLEYVILDEGWYKLGNLLKVKPEMDIAELVKYGESKGVGIILWCVWKTLDDQFEEAFEQFSAWGIKGIKVDFMQRTDQYMTNFYERTAKEAFRRKMLVDFHGGHHPKGLHRTYPNVLTFEGVRGLEWNKWSSKLTPKHDLTIPFTRMITGPMDYTPGAMRNVGNPKKHRASFKNPKSIGTRCHELAKYVVYESPLQMLADAPTAYQKEADAMKFLKVVPTVWDETVVLSAAIEGHLIMARRSGDTWFIGGMTADEGQTISIDLSFLGAGNYTMDIWRDGDDTFKNGSSYVHSTDTGINNGMKYVVSMAEGGGWVAILRKG